MNSRLALCALALVVSMASAASSADGILSYGDGTPDGKRSLGGSGEAILFTIDDGAKIAGIRIHGSRYGVAKAPDEDFLIYFLSQDRSKILHTEMAPYARFKRGEENEWVDVKFKDPIALSGPIWVVLDFRAHQTKGVYVSYDTSSKGDHSRTGLPGMKLVPVNFGGDWMIELALAK